MISNHVCYHIGLILIKLIKQINPHLHNFHQITIQLSQLFYHYKNHFINNRR
jgi:hypothetical protein